MRAGESIKEVWIPIKGFEGYEVSNLGRVRSFKIKADGKILKPRMTRKGYLSVPLRKDGKKYFKQVHRLVLMNFDPVPDMNLLDVNHNDEDKTNNCVNNLCWMTRKENIMHGTCRQRTHEKQKKKIKCIETEIIYPSLTEASASTNINIYNMSRCCNGYLKTAGGYRWRYID